MQTPEYRPPFLPAGSTTSTETDTDREAREEFEALVEATENGKES